jgi:hypothetical protein
MKHFSAVGLLCKRFLLLLREQKRVSVGTMKREGLWGSRMHILASLRGEGFEIWHQRDRNHGKRTYILASEPFWARPAAAEEK